MSVNFKVCPKCQSESITWDGEKKWYCPQCNFTLFHNVAGAVAVILRHENEIFLTIRNQDPGKGKLDLPGGFVDPKETAEETCTRELWEELKVEFSPSEFKYLASLPNVYRYKDISYNTLDLFYESNLKEKFEFNPELSEISEGIWLAKSDLNLEEIAFDSQKKFLEKYLED